MKNATRENAIVDGIDN